MAINAPHDDTADVDYPNSAKIPETGYDERTMRPAHYRVGSPYEVWKVEEAWGLVDDHYLCSVIEYIARHRQKGGVEDLKKALVWLDRRIKREWCGEDAHGVTVERHPNETA